MMQQNNFNILVFLFSLIVLTLTKEIKLSDDIREIISSRNIDKPLSEIVLLDENYKAPVDLVEQLSFKIGSKETYSNSIKTLREKLSDKKWNNVPNLLIKKPFKVDDLILIQISVEGNTVQLVMSNENMYITGFVSGNNFYRFSDPEFSKITVAGKQLQTLKMQSNYPTLAKIAKIDLVKLTIDQNNLLHSFFQLSNYKNTGGAQEQEELALAMLRFIILTSEASRFKYIEGDIAQSVYSKPGKYELGVTGHNVITDWSKFSKYGVRLQKNNTLTETLSISYTIQIGGKDYTVFERSNLYLVLALALNNENLKQGYTSLLQPGNMLD